MIKVLEHLDNHIDILSMKNDELEIIVTNYGCTVMKVLMEDKNGNRDDVVLGYDDIHSYQTLDAYLGALVGRVANRIKLGHFELNGEEYTLAVNNGPNHLHGGIKGFSYQVFDYEIKDENTIVFHYVSPDQEEGYPGTLDFYATYQLVRDTLTVNYHATTTKDTLINITNHSYFNLSGHKENIYQHSLKTNAIRYACIDADGLPTGEIQSVTNTPFDFTKGAYIGERVEQEDEQLLKGHGFDHPFISEDEFYAELSDEKSGRTLIIRSTLPGAQIYTANFLDGRKGKNGETYQARDAICIETQNIPDAIHIEKEPTTILKKGDVYDETTSYQFKVNKDASNNINESNK